jgi:hypothetical protein
MNALPLPRIQKALDNFTGWLDRYGEVSWDHQTYFAGSIGRRAKALYYRNKTLGQIAVAPMILSEALLPSARRFFAPPARFPIADAHYAMGFAFLAQAQNDARMGSRATHFIEQLERSRCPGYEHLCWGYPFDWETRGGTLRQGTPMITSTPYVYEAYQALFTLDAQPRWKSAMASIVRHATSDIKDFRVSETASMCSYTPFDKGGVVNASAYRAFLLAAASVDLNEERYWSIGERNLNFVLEAQRPNGSWYYSVDGERDFVDHFHTCFVLKALAKIQRLKPNDRLQQAIILGVDYYAANLLDERGLPKPFSKAPRMTVYRRELYDYAECLNLAAILRDSIPSMNAILARVLDDLLERWVKPNGSFRSRELWFGWDNVPMHRWAQSQMFRSLSLITLNESRRQSASQVA